MSPSRRNFFLFHVLLSLALLAATALAAERSPEQPAAGFTPRYSVGDRMSLELSLEWAAATVDPATGRIYSLADFQRRLSVIATQPALTETPIDLPFKGATLVLSLDGSRLYVLEETEYDDREGRIAVFNTATLTVMHTFLFTCPDIVSYGNCRGAAIAGPGNRLYVLLGDSMLIDIHDGVTGERLLRFTHPGDMMAGFTINGTNLYSTAYTSTSPKAILRRFNISAVTPVLSLSREMADYAFHNLKVAPDGSFLILYQTMRNGVALQLDANSLNTIRNYPTSGEAYYADAIISSNSDEIVLRWGYPPDDVYHSIETYDAATGALRRIGYATDNEPSRFDQKGLLPLPNNEIAKLFVNDILILHPNDYAATAPVVMANYCGGPFIDTFDDPATGWPQADLGPVAYRYDNGNYSILQRESDRWSAVSRGDVWNNWERAGVRTWVPAGDGMSGLVFGLNADWSEFYTLEIIPSDRRWVVLAYHTATGWELKATGHGAGGPNESTSLLLIQPEDGSLAILVNDRLVFGLPTAPIGRIGLSGGSFDDPVDLRFDDYIIATGPNCFHPGGRATAIERSPVIERPPLEELLK